MIIKIAKKQQASHTPAAAFFEPMMISSGLGIVSGVLTHKINKNLSNGLVLGGIGSGIINGLLYQNKLGRMGEFRKDVGPGTKTFPGLFAAGVLTAPFTSGIPIGHAIYHAKKKGLQKTAANRMTKKLSEGSLKEHDFNRIINEKSGLRPDDQIISGLKRGNQNLAKKMNVRVFDLNTPIQDSGFSMAESLRRDIVENNKGTWIDSISIPEVSINTPFGNQKSDPFILSDHKTNSLDAAIAERHELFEQKSMLRHKRNKLKGQGNLFGDVNFNNSNKSTGNIRNGLYLSISQHDSGRVLGEESNEVARLFSKKKMELPRLRERFILGGNEADYVKQMTGKKYGTRLSSKDLRKLDKPLSKMHTHIGYKFAIPAIAAGLAYGGYRYNKYLDDFKKPL